VIGLAVWQRIADEDGDSGLHQASKYVHRSVE